MKKGLKDFLTGVGSVLDISPNTHHKSYKVTITVRPPKNLNFDLDVVGEDFRTIGKDLEDVLQRAFSENRSITRSESIAKHESIMAEMERLDLAVKRLQEISGNSTESKEDNEEQVGILARK